MMKEQPIESIEDTGRFWLDDTNSFWNNDEGSTFLVREFTNELPTPWTKRNKDFVRELLFFLSLLAGGIVIIAINWSVVDDATILVASMLFASGLIPLLQSVLFDILPRQFTRSARGITLDDILSTALSAAFVVAALLLQPNPKKEDESWGFVAGTILFEAGLIYFVTRVFFFGPNPPNEVRSLKKEVEELKQSMALGLADGYFWNLVREISIDIRDAKEYGPDGGKLKLTYGRDGEALKHVDKFLILIPRELDWSKEDPIADLIREYKGLNYFKDCKIEKSPQRAESSRVKWVTDIIPGNGGEDDQSEFSYDVDTCIPSGSNDSRVVVDIPTTLTAMLMSLKAQCEKTTGVNNTNYLDINKFHKEVSAFSFRLAWHLKKENLEKYAAVVEIKSTADLITTIENIKKSI
mmetsp:Transcript_28158/g.42610  ORF Transcript_28158/g.42610 Transcript_28158/m.42610 type:complete len:409 (+) Transcript_28158:47-1273(+)